MAKVISIRSLNRQKTGSPMSGVILREASKGVYNEVHDRRRPKGVDLKILYTSRKGTPESASRRGYDRMGVIYFPFRSYLMKKVRTWYELLHKVLSSRAI